MGKDLLLTLKVILSCVTVFVQVFMEIHNFCGQHKDISLGIQIYVLTNIMFFKTLRNRIHQGPVVQN